MNDPQRAVEVRTSALTDQRKEWIRRAQARIWPLATALEVAMMAKAMDPDRKISIYPEDALSGRAVRPGDAVTVRETGGVGLTMVYRSIDGLNGNYWASPYGREGRILSIHSVQTALSQLVDYGPR